VPPENFGEPECYTTQLAGDKWISFGALENNQGSAFVQSTAGRESTPAAVVVLVLLGDVVSGVDLNLIGKHPVARQTARKHHLEGIGPAHQVALYWRRTCH
jgi:hypothetical protein